MSKSHRNPFTKEQISLLRKNQYVKGISSSTISFTEEFKNLFHEKHSSGITTSKIFNECGIDPEILGESRISGFRHSLNKRAKLGNDFSDKRKNNSRKAANKTMDGNASTDTRLSQLEHQLAYAIQQIEFLKKIPPEQLIISTNLML